MRISVAVNVSKRCQHCGCNNFSIIMCNFIKFSIRCLRSYDKAVAYCLIAPNKYTGRWCLTVNKIIIYAHDGKLTGSAQDKNYSYVFPNYRFETTITSTSRPLIMIWWFRNNRICHPGGHYCDYYHGTIYSISQEICTRFLLCCALLWLYIDWFSHIHQAYFTGTLAI